MKPIFTAEGLDLVKNNGKVVKDALSANEKALDEHKWFLSGPSKDGKPRKRSTYVQYLRGKMEAYREMVDGIKLSAWEPKPVSASTNVSLSSDQLKAIVEKAVQDALKAK